MSHNLYINHSARAYRCRSGISTDTSCNFEFSYSTTLAFHRKFFSSYPQTPLINLPTLAEELGVKHLLVKFEGERYGLPAFKILGASWATCTVLAQRLGVDLERISDLKEFRDLLDAEDKKENRTKPVLYSSTEGNHGRAVARTANLLGLQAKIYVPDSVSELSREAIRSEGAEVVIVQGDYDDAVRIASKDAGIDKDRSILIQDTAWEGYEEIPNLIVQGYSTMFAEIDEQLATSNIPSPSLVVVPVGVGSLAHSAVRYYRRSSSFPGSSNPSSSPKSSSSSSSSILTVEPKQASCLNTSLHAGHPVIVRTSHNIMPGLTCGTVSSTAFPDLLGGVDLSIVVDDDDDGQVVKAMKDLKELGVNAGPCGAASLAGVRGLKKTDLEKGNGNLDEDMVVVLICTEGDG
ncbi:tryptophan synthase beta subunit-like PLP-dependent enzyme [Dendrothele bispora CBS 962.96]|uniref:Tryptophan synthase beta subunit-like PLP-dependent enzyme n=1 Tax=Dendrothele bispora (strain CBS 962.96) TaxID=1314807 RepID=A0A4V4HG57_DENBC|nr:tryptophan synthase beta subunit-like PLP-dependent enzyme [Dendrothele bispora CBS 962.96]